MSQPLFILAVIIMYFVAWMFVSYFSSKGADNATFFSGNRRMAWPLVAIAMIGAPISGVTFISVPGMVMAKGYSYLQMGLGFIVGYALIALVLIPLYYKFNIVSIYEFLQRRFGSTSRKTGAWLFFVSKILGISVRFLMICAMLQLLVFDPLGIPYVYSVLVSLGLVWISTFKGGVKSVIWGDVLKSACLIGSIVLCLFFVMGQMDWSFGDMATEIGNHASSRMFFFDDPSDSKYFWKQFVAGIFLVIAMTGLDQDMMQRTLTCKNARDSRKNLLVSSVMQFVVIACLLMLGTVMLIFSEAYGDPLPERSDNLFALVAFHEGMPLIMGGLFILGMVSATYSSVASALTSMTTTMTVDILGGKDSGGNSIVSSDKTLRKKRVLIHTLISATMAILVIVFYYLNNDDAISMVYTLVSYTDGPILGLFLFGIVTKRKVNEKLLPLTCCLAPLLSWATQYAALEMFDYEIGYELLLLNAGYAFLGLSLISQPERKALIDTAV